jgi:phenylacetate-CoA ligase
MSAFDSLYAKLPIMAQHIVVTAYGFYWRQLRFGSGYHHFVHTYQEREQFSKEQWSMWQAEKIKHLLQACANHVPYYREHWTETQKRSTSNGDMSTLPLLEKGPIRTDPRAFLCDNIRPRRPQIFLTSGSTGTPIASYYTIPELRQSMAVREVRSAGWAGVSFKLPRATFSGRMVEPLPSSKGPYYRFNAAERQVYLGNGLCGLLLFAGMFHVGKKDCTAASPEGDHYHQRETDF